MSNTLLTGNVSFVNHEKKYIIIEYEVNGKKKVVNGSTGDKLQKTKHVFHIGDTVSFTVGLSGRGDKMVASDIKFLYNNALDVLINKAKTENNFIGYLKIVDDKYYVKEIESYLFFPATISPWQLKPTDEELNEAVTFALKKQEPIHAEIYKITEYGIYLNLFGNKVQAKISPAAENLPENLKVGDKIHVRISDFSKGKIVGEHVL